MSDRAIEVDNVGGVESVKIPIPQGGGVVVLEGRNGAGKTQALEAIGALGGDSKITVRDGTQTGRVAGLGASLTVMKTNRRRGDLEVQIVSGSAIDDVIDPQIADQEKADAARIKALIKLTGAKLTVEMVESVLGASIEDYGDLDDDAVVAVDRLRRWLQQNARDAEAEADKSLGEAKVLRPAGDIPVAAETPADAMARWQKQIAEAAAIRSKFDTQQLEVRRAEDAKAKLAGVTAKLEPTGQIKAKRDRLVERAAKLTAELETIQGEIKECNASLAESARHEAIVKQLTEAATIPTDGRVTEAEVQAAEQLAAEHRAAYDRAVAAEQAIKNAAAAKAAEQRAEVASKAAATIRAAADRLPSVFGKMLACNRLVVEDGRLFVTHPAKPKELFSRLSFGEKVRLLLPIAVRVMQPDDVLVLAQHICEGLDPTGFQEMVDAAKDHKIVIATARATGDETLVPRVYQ